MNIALTKGYEFTSGYHGTDLITARSIFDNGFDASRFYTHFAPSDNYELAKGHGDKNARRSSVGKYAVIGVDFNQIGRIESDYGSIIFYEDELDLIEVTDMTIYQVNDIGGHETIVERIVKSSPE